MPRSRAAARRRRRSRQARCPQDRTRTRSGGGPRCAPRLPSELLARLQSDRARLVEAEGAVAKGGRTHPPQTLARASLRSSRHHPKRFAWLVLTLRLPRSMFLRTALETQLYPDLDRLPRRNVEMPIGRNGVPLQVTEETFRECPHRPLPPGLHALASKVVRGLFGIDRQPKEWRRLDHDLRDVRLLHEAVGGNDLEDA